jgi:hypothetical protein
LPEYCFYRRDAENAEFTFLLFSFERKENNNHKPYGYKKILWEHLNLITLRCLLPSTTANIFFFSALSAEKKKISSANSATLANLPEADKAGGEKHALTYPP